MCWNLVKGSCSLDLDLEHISFTLKLGVGRRFQGMKEYVASVSLETLKMKSMCCGIVTVSKRIGSLCLINARTWSWMKNFLKINLCVTKNVHLTYLVFWYHLERKSKMFMIFMFSDFVKGWFVCYIVTSNSMLVSSNMLLKQLSNVISVFL